MSGLRFTNQWKHKNWLLYHRWLWHLLFWTGYAVFRFWPYYITVSYYPSVFLVYMLFSEIMFVGITYFTIWLYTRFFQNKRYVLYSLVGIVSWLLFLCGRTLFQLHYLRNEPSFKGSTFGNIVLNNLTFVLIAFLFVTACKYFKDGYILQHVEEEKKQQQLLAEMNNLKSQIAPHFLFNTLNNLYGLAVDKSDKLPGLMLRLSDLLRHSLYETQKPLVMLDDEINVLKSYVELETLRLEEDLKLVFNNAVPTLTQHQIAPLVLIVFLENAFKHAKLVQAEPVEISINTTLQDNWFRFTIKNNYNHQKASSANGLGLTNVQRRLDVLYPQGRHQLTITKDGTFHTVTLQLQLR